MLLPVVAKLLAPITGGLSLVALGVYNAAKAIKNKDVLGFISAGATGATGLGLDKAAKVLKGISNVASAGQNAYWPLKRVVHLLCWPLWHLVPVLLLALLVIKPVTWP